MDFESFLIKQALFVNVELQILFLLSHLRHITGASIPLSSSRFAHIGSDELERPSYSFK